MGILGIFGRGEAAPVEDRAGYTDTVTQALLDASADTVASGYTSALETAASQMGRAFAAAGATGRDAGAFDAWTLAQIGRSLVECGEAVWLRTGRRIERGDHYGITPGGVYDFSQFGRRARADRVMHVRWNIDIDSWRGVSPLANARTLNDLLKRLEGSLATEANAAVGYLLPVPSDGQSDGVKQLKQDLENLKGRIAIVETTRAGWQGEPSGAPRRDFDLARMGPNFPEGNVRLFRSAREAVLAACGYPVQLDQDSDGTAQREAWRRYLHGTVAPCGRLVEAAAAAADLQITLSWDRLFASDIQGRARAFQSMVGAGMSIEDAAAASGILAEDA